MIENDCLDSTHYQDELLRFIGMLDGRIRFHCGINSSNARKLGRGTSQILSGRIGLPVQVVVDSEEAGALDSLCHRVTIAVQGETGSSAEKLPKVHGFLGLTWSPEVLADQIGEEAIELAAKARQTKAELRQITKMTKS